MNKVVHFSDSLTLTLLMFLAELLGGLALKIYQKCSFHKKGIKKSFNFGIKLIQKGSKKNKKKVFLVL